MFLHDRDQLPMIVRPVISTAATCPDLYFINSVHDPYGCDDTQGRSMSERLGGTQIVRDDGHFAATASPTKPSSCPAG
jgi:hypothetical protein